MSFDGTFKKRACGVKSVSIPLEQGNVFRLATTVSATESGIRLNPFGTGQCLSTYPYG